MRPEPVEGAVFDELRRHTAARRSGQGWASWCEEKLPEHSTYVVEHLEDLPEMRD